MTSQCTPCGERWFVDLSHCTRCSILCDVQVLLVAVALAFDAQMVPFVPTARHDVNVDILVTAQELLACSSRGDTVLTAASLA